MSDKRPDLLARMGQLVKLAAATSQLDGKPLAVLDHQAIAGPRAGAVQFSAGLDASRLLNALAANDCAVARQMIPWSFPSDPAVYMSSRFVRLEAAWSDDLAERDIRLDQLPLSPRPAGTTWRQDGTERKREGRWIAGKNEFGATVTLGLNDNTPHYLIGGYTGSGKTETFRAMLAQLARDPSNQFVAIDGKFGAGLRPLEVLPGMVGPCALDVESARRALAWSIAEMRRRYALAPDDRAGLGRLVVAIDEVQEFAGRGGDGVVTEMIGKLARMGREVKVHCIIGTQHPSMDALADSTIKRNLPGRIALRVDSPKASEVVIGQATPRADWLLGRGDAYIVTPSAIQRVQIAHLPLAEIVEQHRGGKPRLEEYPEFDATCAGSLGDEAVRSRDNGTNLALALLAARLGKKRTALGTMFEEADLPRPGSDRLDRLVKIGQEQLIALNEFREKHGWTLCE